MAFPDGFIWGVAASAPQIEGAAAAHGKSDSVWDVFARGPGRIADKSDPSSACQHLERLDEDLDLIAQLGANAYRLSIAWPRVVPDGIGTASREGLDVYDRVIDGLLARGIEPWVTLFHWDMPEPLFRQGGWQSRRSVEAFEQYTQVVVNRLSDRVKNWITINEPQCYLGIGHIEGRHAPGLKLDEPRSIPAIHNALLAHGRAVEAIRGHARGDTNIGLASTGEIGVPATETPGDIDAARRATCAIPAGDGWFFNNTWYLDPIYRGTYPDDGLTRFGEHLPTGFEKDLDGIRQPLDFLGLNIYRASTIRDGDGTPEIVPEPVGGPLTMHHWPVTPAAMHWGTFFLNERYDVPIYITENGCAGMDWVHVDGRVHDAPRIDFMHRYLAELERAVHAGVDVRGYFHWSILDNFEWAEGYRMRFGLVFVDFETQKRTPKDSYHFYRTVIESSGLPEPAGSAGETAAR